MDTLNFQVFTCISWVQTSFLKILKKLNFQISITSTESTSKMSQQFKKSRKRAVGSFPTSMILSNLTDNFSTSARNFRPHSFQFHLGLSNIKLSNFPFQLHASQIQWRRTIHVEKLLHVQREISFFQTVLNFHHPVSLESRVWTLWSGGYFSNFSNEKIDQKLLKFNIWIVLHGIYNVQSCKL